MVVFVQSVQRGGIVSVVRDWNGNIIKKILGPVDSSYANEAELLALLIGSHELCKMGGFNPIL